MEKSYQELIIFSAIGVVIFIVILYFIIESAVAGGTRKQRKLLEKQNDILLKMLNQQGVNKQELLDMFVAEKKDVWTSMRP